MRRYAVRTWSATHTRDAAQDRGEHLIDLGHPQVSGDREGDHTEDAAQDEGDDDPHDAAGPARGDEEGQPPHEQRRDDRGEGEADVLADDAAQVERPESAAQQPEAADRGCEVGQDLADGDDDGDLEGREGQGGEGDGRGGDGDDDLQVERVLASSWA